MCRPCLLLRMQHPPCYPVKQNMLAIPINCIIVLSTDHIKTKSYSEEEQTIEKEQKASIDKPIYRKLKIEIKETKRGYAVQTVF